MSETQENLVETAISILRRGMPLPSDIRWQLTDEQWREVQRIDREYREEQAQWSRLKKYAGEIDFEVEVTGSSFSLMGHDIAITFNYDAAGREQAYTWLEEYDDENYEPEW